MFMHSICKAVLLGIEGLYQSGLPSWLHAPPGGTPESWLLGLGMSIWETGNLTWALSVGRHWNSPVLTGMTGSCSSPALLDQQRSL